MLMLSNAIESEIWRRLKRRFFTPSGCKVALAVTATATSVTWTFDRGEVDTAYGVNALPSWLTTVACTAKTTTSCTLSFGTAAPANATVDVHTFRTE
jgi:hypothetical protein